MGTDDGRPPHVMFSGHHDGMRGRRAETVRTSPSRRGPRSRRTRSPRC